MTVDEMICALYKEDFTVRDTEAVTAALRAGQILRAVCDYDMEDALRTKGYSLSADEVNNARRAWDNATEKEV